MIQSMTGYGRGRMETEKLTVQVELKSVNHRYFEFSARVPRTYSFLEEKLKALVQSQVSRGKVDCFVQIDILDGEACDVHVNHTLADGYRKAIEELAQRCHVPNDATASVIARYSDVLSVYKAEADEEEIWNAVQQATHEAIAAFVRMREQEGEKLKADVGGRAARILELVAEVETRSPQTVKAYHEKLYAKLSELLESTQIDEQRILTEAALFADKVAVDEETVRLRSHLEQLEAFLNAEEAVGRKMDFLVQEINREANTIGSKAGDVEIARNVVEIKSEIEKIREQIQNIE